MNRASRNEFFQAHRALIVIAAGGGRRPEPVEIGYPNTPNPIGVELLSCGKASVTYLTPAGSVGMVVPAIHGFRCASPAAIIVITPTGLRDGNA